MRFHVPLRTGSDGTLVTWFMFIHTALCREVWQPPLLWNCVLIKNSIWNQLCHRALISKYLQVCIIWLFLSFILAFCYKGCHGKYKAIPWSDAIFTCVALMTVHITGESILFWIQESIPKFQAHSLWPLWVAELTVLQWQTLLPTGFWRCICDPPLMSTRLPPSISSTTSHLAPLISYHFCYSLIYFTFPAVFYILCMPPSFLLGTMRSIIKT